MTQCEQNKGQEEKVFQVETIVSERTVKGCKEYLVKWKGDISQNETWESSTLINALAPFQLTAFLDAKKKKKRSESFNRKGDPWNKPIRCISCYRTGGTLFYRVEYPGDVFKTVSADALRETDPEIICNYLENKIQFIAELSC